MPEGTDVVFVEADLEGVVGQEGLKNFEVALKTRRARRKEKVEKTIVPKHEQKRRRGRHPQHWSGIRSCRCIR